MSVKTLNLNSLTDENFESEIRAFGSDRNRPMNGEVCDIETKISAFENRYEISSKKMVEELRAKTRKETFEICAWLMLLKAREKLAQHTVR